VWPQLKEAKKMENKPGFVLVDIKRNIVTYSAFSFSANFTRVFYCNSIEFVNSGTSNVFINDVFLLQPGTSQSNNGSPNEMDITVYKITFAPGGINNLQVWIKIDQGSAHMADKLTSYSGAKIIDRRTQMLRYSHHTKKKANF
jgi:hypothetical protein